MSVSELSEPALRAQTWEDLGHLTRLYYADPAARHHGEGWFASLSLHDCAELNVCGLFPPVTPDGARQLLGAVGPDLPVIAFTSAHAHEARSVLTDAGFGWAPLTEPVMCLPSPPADVESPFHARLCDGPGEIETALRLNAEAHQISYDMLVRATAHVFETGLASVWLAFDGDEPVSTVSICRDGPVLGVMEMMTPARHQRRGAGRALLAHVLRESWDSDVDRAVLFSSAAGARLYESLGFIATDDSVTCFRGLDDEVLEAIGQAL